MNKTIKIKNGICRSVKIKNKIFETIDNQIALRPGKDGTFLNLFNRENQEFPQKKVRVYVNQGDFEILGDAHMVIDMSTRNKVDTDEEKLAKIKTQFNIMEKMVYGCTTGQIKGFSISGGAGVGKSFNVQRILEQEGMLPVIFEHDDGKNPEDVPDELAILADQIDELAKQEKKYYVVVKGRVTPLGLYKTLYDHKDKIIVFDDCDSILNESISLNLLKAALDSYERRIICYNSRAIGDLLPRKFEFTGSIIFISNVEFDNVREGSKLRPHIDAIMSRCHYVNLDLKSNRDKILRIKQVISESDLFGRYPDLTEIEKKEIVDFIDKYQNRLREISLRTALKLADIRMLCRDPSWLEMAKACCLVNENEAA